MVYRDVRWQVTDACNSKCLYCFPDAGRAKKNEISGKELINFLKKYIKGMKVFTFTGGEPLIRVKEVLLVNAFLRKHRIKTRLFTNGFTLNERIARQFDIIQISLDTYDENIHDYHRNLKDAFKAASRAIKIATPVTNVWVRTTITKKNYKDMKKTIKLCEKLGVKEWWARPMILFGRGKEVAFLKPTKKHVKRALHDVEEMKKKTKMRLYILPYCDPDKISDPRVDEMCPDLMITSDGMLKSCGFSNNYIGSIKNE